MAAKMIGATEPLSTSRRRLLGSYFTMEYAVASAALFNPSIVPHPNQEGVPEGGLRFIMSLRATGEGHVSSIVFRTGVIGPGRVVEFDPLGSVMRRARLSPDQFYNKPLFRRKLREMAIDQKAVELVLNGANVNFVAFSRFGALGLDGQVVSMFVIVLAAAEAAVALAIALNFYNNHLTIDVDRADELKG